MEENESLKSMDENLNTSASNGQHTGFKRTPLPFQPSPPSMKHRYVGGWQNLMMVIDGGNMAKRLLKIIRTQDKPNISSMVHEKTTQRFFDVKSEGNNEGHHRLSSATKDIPDTYEDYLLDAEYLECVSDMNSVPGKQDSRGNLNLDQQCGDSGLTQCNVMKEGWCTSSKLVSEANKNSLLLHKMTVDEGILVESKEDVISTSASNPLTGVFNFRTKPRSRHMRRYKHTNSNYMSTFSVEDTDVLSSVPDMKDKVIVNVIRRKHKPAQRYTSRSIAKSSRFPNRTCM